MLSDSLKTLRAKHGMSQADLAKKLSVTQQAVGRWEREQTSPDFAMLKKMADIFNVSTDYLLGVHPPQKNSLPSLNAKDEREITRMMDDMKDRLMQEEGLMFDGQPASPESIQSILDAMQIGMEMAKKRNKAKYTPKKYRPEG
jgi:XRE family transcriptional regulator